MTSLLTVPDGRLVRARAETVPAMLSFLVLTFSWSWGFGWGASQLSPLNSVGRTAMIIASGYGPSLAGFAVVGMFSEFTDFRKWIAGCFSTRLAWRWFAMAFLAPPAVMLTALAILALAGGQVQPISAFEHIPLVIANFGLVLLIGGPLGEEFGWRGYAMSALSSRMDSRVASLFIGVIWGVWHLPLFSWSGRRNRRCR